MPATAIIDRTMKAGVIRSRRNQAARNRIISGSSAHSRTYRLAVMVVSPIRPSAYARPGLRRPSRPRSSGEPSVRNEIPWRRMRTASTARLAASWTGSSVNGGISSRAALLMTVPTPQQVAARISAARSRGAMDERDMAVLREGTRRRSGRGDRWFLVVAARVARHSPATRSSSLHPRHGYAKARCIATALVEQAVSNSTERATSTGTLERSITA